MKDKQPAESQRIVDLKAKYNRLQDENIDLEEQVLDQIAELRQGNEALEQEILERIQIETQLRESNDLLETIFSNIHLMIAYLDTDFNFIRVNEAYAKAAGRSSSFFPGKNHFTLFPHPENERIFRSTVSSGKPYSVLEKPFIYPEDPNRTTWWDWSLLPLKSDQGTAYGLILSLLDVTGRVEARKKKEAFSQELKRQNKALSEFTFIASHDLQEPLRKIIAFGDLLELHIGETLTPEDRDYLNRMTNAAHRMQTMLEGLLKYSRAAAEQQTYSNVDLTHAAHEALSNLDVQIEKTAATVTIEKLPIIYADYTQIIQLFQNLIGNALKFHRKGVTPHVRVSGSIYANDEKQGLKCKLKIEDNGIGFDVNHVERIFLPFTRLQGRQGPDGAGLGLSICKKIVEGHNGTISAESFPGKGSIFWISLPAKPSSVKLAIGKQIS